MSDLRTYTAVTELARAAGAAAILIFWTPAAIAASSDIAKIVSFTTASQCAQKGRYRLEDCVQAFDAAHRVYSDKVPTFRTREACNRAYTSCVVYVPFPVQRLDPSNLRYAPPFLGIAKPGPGSELDTIVALVGIERSGIRMAVTRLRPPVSATGHFELPGSSPASPAAQARPAAISAEAPVIIDGALFPDPLPGQVLTYPVPKHLLPKRIANPG